LNNGSPPKGKRAAPKKTLPSSVPKKVSKTKINATAFKPGIASTTKKQTTKSRAFGESPLRRGFGQLQHSPFPTNHILYSAASGLYRVSEEKEETRQISCFSGSSGSQKTVKTMPRNSEATP
jgi:hypothetical protein